MVYRVETFISLMLVGRGREILDFLLRLWFVLFILHPQNLEIQHGSLLALGFTVGRYLSKTKVRMVELHDLEEPNTIVVPKQDQLIKSTTETIGQATLFIYLYLIFVSRYPPLCGAQGG